MTKRKLTPGFTQLPLWLKVSPELTTTQKAVYAEVVSHVRDNPSGWPSVNTMARALGRSTKSVERAIARLEQEQLIRVERTKGKASHYFVLAHPWQDRDKSWAEERAKAARSEAAKRASERAEARRGSEPPAPWAPDHRQNVGGGPPPTTDILSGVTTDILSGVTTDKMSVMNRHTSKDEIFEETKGTRLAASPTVNIRPDAADPHDATTDTTDAPPPVPVGSPSEGPKVKFPTADELKGLAQNAKKAPPKLAVVKELRPKGSQTAPAAPPKHEDDLRRVEQAWRASMAKYYPAVPVAKGDWKAASGPGASAAKLLSEYSAEQVLRYVTWVPEAWEGLQRQHPKLLGAPTIGIAASRWSESWMPLALGATGAGSSEYDIAVANLTKWMDEHPDTVFAPDELTQAVTRAKGKHGKL